MVYFCDYRLMMHNFVVHGNWLVMNYSSIDCNRCLRVILNIKMESVIVHWISMNDRIMFNYLMFNSCSNWSDWLMDNQRIMLI